MRRSLVIFLFVLSSGALILGYFVFTPRLSHSLFGGSEAGAEIPVRVVQAKASELPRVKHVGGELRPLYEIDVVSQLGGVVREIRYKPGDRVAAGAVLAIIESKELLARLHDQERAIKESEDDLRARAGQLGRAEKELATIRDLHQRELIARRDVEQAEAELNAARARTEVSQALVVQRESMLKQTRYLLDLSRLIAPWPGVVTQTWVEARAVAAASTKILSLANADTMRLTVPVAAADAANLHSGTTLRARIDALPGHEFTVRVAHVSPPSEGEKSAMAEIRLTNNDDLIKSGMKAVVSLPTSGTETVVLLPREAVFELGGKKYVYTVAAGKAQQREVVQGGEQNGKVVISSGLTPGDAVVVAGVKRLQPGSRVRVVE